MKETDQIWKRRQSLRRLGQIIKIFATLWIVVTVLTQLVGLFVWGAFAQALATEMGAPAAIGPLFGVASFVLGIIATIVPPIIAYAVGEIIMFFGDMLYTQMNIIHRLGTYTPAAPSSPRQKKRKTEEQDLFFFDQ